MAWELLDERDQRQDLCADKGYDWQQVKDGIALAKMSERVLKQARKNKPLSDADKQRNTELSRVMARVENVFGGMNEQLGALRVRAIRLVRATFRVCLSNLCYNIQRFLHLISNSFM